MPHPGCGCPDHRACRTPGSSRHRASCGPLAITAPERAVATGRDRCPEVNRRPFSPVGSTTGPQGRSTEGAVSLRTVGFGRPGRCPSRGLSGGLKQSMPSSRLERHAMPTKQDLDRAQEDAESARAELSGTYAQLIAQEGLGGQLPRTSPSSGPTTMGQQPASVPQTRQAQTTLPGVNAMMGGAPATLPGVDAMLRDAPATLPGVNAMGGAPARFPGIDAMLSWAPANSLAHASRPGQENPSQVQGASSARPAPPQASGSPAKSTGHKLG